MRLSFRAKLLMRKELYIVFVMSLLLQSCDFFYSTVDYKGREADARLCVVTRETPPDSLGDPFHVNVLHSVFFLNDDDYTLPVLKDAKVSVKVNHSSYKQAVYTPNSDTVFAIDGDGFVRSRILDGRYEVPLLFAAKDTVRLHVEHPTYGTADAMQVCPEKQPFKLTVDSLSQYGELWCHMFVPAYKGDTSDVLTIQAAVFDDDLSDNGLSIVAYSDNEAFGYYDNYQTNAGYYAGYQLHMQPAGSGRNIPLVFDLGLRSMDVSEEITPDTILICAYMLARTRDDYLYHSTLYAALGQSLAVTELISERQKAGNTGNENFEFNIEQIFDEIAENFAVLGNAEGYQVYSNMEGKNGQNVRPFGCFSLVNVTEQNIEYVVK